MKNTVVDPQLYNSIDDCSIKIKKLFKEFFTEIGIIFKNHEKFYPKPEIPWDQQLSSAQLIIEISPIKSIIKHYKDKILVHKKYILERNEIFFIDKDELYLHFPKETIAFIKELFRKKKIEGGLSNKTREILWDYMESILLLIEKYIELKKILKKNK